MAITASCNVTQRHAHDAKVAHDDVVELLAPEQRRIPVAQLPSATSRAGGGTHTHNAAHHRTTRPPYGSRCDTMRPLCENRELEVVSNSTYACADSTRIA